MLGGRMPCNGKVLMDATQTPVAPPQFLERVRSAAGTVLPERTATGWARFARSFLAVFALGLLLALAAIVALDPLDSGRFPSFTKGGPLDADGRVANVSRGRDARFNAAIIGNSHLMLLDPKRLSAATGLSFVQLAVPA